MKKITSFLALVAMVTALARSAFAIPTVELPEDKRGNAIPNYAGYKYTRVNSASGEQLPCTGKCLVAGLIMGTGPTTSFVQIRDTAAADGLTVGAITPLRFEANSRMTNNFIALPLIFNSGIAIKLNASSNGEDVTLLWMKLN